MTTGRLLAIGLLAGLLGGMFGIGGGLLIVPGLLLIGVDRRLAHGTSLAATLLIAVGSFVSYLVNDNIDWGVALPLGVGGIAGALAGTKLLQRLRNAALAYGFALLLLATAVRLFIDTDADGRGELTLLGIAGLVAIGVATGIVAGLFGVGGGIVMVPAMVVLYGIPPAVAKGTSVTVIFPTALSGTIDNYRRRNLDVHAALVLGGAGMLTGIIGGLIADAMSPTTSNVLFGLLLVVVAARQVHGARTEGSEPERPSEASDVDDHVGSRADTRAEGTTA